MSSKEGGGGSEADLPPKAKTSSWDDLDVAAKKGGGEADSEDDSGRRNQAKRAMKVVGATVGASVGKSIATNAVTTAALSSIEALGTTAATASLISRAQLQSMGLIALRLPLANTERLEQFSAAVAAFTVEHENTIVQVSEMTAAEQIFAAGFQSNAVATLAAAAVQQSVNVVYLCKGWSTKEEFKDASVAVALAGTGSLAGGIGGAAVGTLFVPGAGTVIGSLIGSFGGSFVPGAMVARYNDSLGAGGPAGEEARYAALRRLKCIECEDGEWLEVVDFPTTEASFLNVDALALEAKTKVALGGASTPPTTTSDLPEGHVKAEGAGPATAHSLFLDPDHTMQILNEGSSVASSEEGSSRSKKLDPEDDLIECGPTDVILFLKNTDAPSRASSLQQQ